MKKKVAICFKGLNDEFEESYENIKKCIYDSLENHGYEHITFATSTINNPEKFLSFVNTYKPVKITLNQERKAPRWNEVLVTGSDQTIVPYQLIECMNMVDEYEKENQMCFDTILILRSDLTFNKSLHEYDINDEHVNMECMFVPDYNSGDCFFWIPLKFKQQANQSFKDIVNERGSSHQAWSYFKRNGVSTHYVCGETSKRNPEYGTMFRFTRYIK